MIKNNGGPAFPVADPNQLNPMSISEYERAAHGMTLRDYFAAKAMQANRSRNSNYSSWEDLAKDSYELADAMLLERDK